MGDTYLNNQPTMQARAQAFTKSVWRYLLCDKSTGKNIIWATSAYAEADEREPERKEITLDWVRGEKGALLRPRSQKAKEEQTARTREKGEVFTPSWVCNKQNNLIDTEWFRRADVFNTETETGWVTNGEKIDFAGAKKGWQGYVDAKRLEITCGEAPYLVSRYDTVTGEPIPLTDRIGLLDRKLRVVNENAADDADWVKWSRRAVESCYGYDFQGDNLLLARINVLNTYIDYYTARFGVQPAEKRLREIANVIAWNLWQMDGLKMVAPYSCTSTVQEYETILGNEKIITPCPGCVQGDNDKHTGVYCKVFDWTSLKQSIPFITLVQGGTKHGKI